MTTRVKRRSDNGKLHVVVLAGVILLSIGYLPAQAGFCSIKNPGTYSDRERLQLMTDSAWARIFRAEPPNEISSTQGNFASSPGGDRQGSPPALHSASLPARSPALRQGATASPLAFYGAVTIRWETAAPIRQLSGTMLPVEFQNDHVISVKGLPASVLRPDRAFAPHASLTVPNRQPNSAEFVALTQDKSTLLLAFPIFDPPITPLDKTILFQMTLDGITLDVKFEPKKMACGGRLIL